MNREQSVIDDIDALVDEQMAGGEPLGGYDYDDPDYPKCPHCHRDWHGLAITGRIEQMAARYTMDPDYRYAEDTSPVLCPGSEFIGPVASPSQLALIRHPGNRGIDLGETLLPGLQPWQQHMIRNPEMRRRVMAFCGGRQPSWTWNDHGTVDNPEDAVTPRWSTVSGLRVNDGDRVVFTTASGVRFSGIARIENGPVDDPNRPWLTQQTIHLDPVVERPSEIRGMTAGPVVYDEAIDPMRSAQNRLAEIQERLRGVLRDAEFDLDTRMRRPADEYTIRPGSWFPDETHFFPDGDLAQAVQTPQQRALPRPSTTPPMWANDPTRSRRTRNSARSIRTPRI